MVEGVNSLFQAMDVDCSGSLSWSEFSNAMKDPEMTKYFRAIDIDTVEAQNLFRLLDIEDRGEVDYVEFLDSCLRLKGPAKAVDLVTVVHEGRRRDARMSKFVWQVQNDLVQASKERSAF